MKPVMIGGSVISHSYYYIHIIQIYSGITSGRVLDGELIYIKILEVNMFAFAYRLFHEDFFPIDVAELCPVD